MLTWSSLRNASQNGNFGTCGSDRLFQVLQMSLSADPVENHPGKIEGWIKMGKSVYQGRRAPCHAPSVYNQYDGDPEPFGHLGAAARFRLALIAVEKPHYAFDQTHAGFFHKTPEQTGIPVTAQHPPVKVAALCSGYLRVKPGVYEVGSHLERLHIETSGLQSREKPERNGRLAASAVRSTYQEGVFFPFLPAIFYFRVGGTGNKLMRSTAHPLQNAALARSLRRFARHEGGKISALGCSCAG